MPADLVAVILDAVVLDAVVLDAVRDFGRVAPAVVASLACAGSRSFFAAARRAVLVRELLFRAVLVREVLAGLAEDIVLAAAVRAFAAVVMALVAVFIDCIAEDIVFADAVALVAAAVILVAADVTLVAADVTVLAAVVGVAELRLRGSAVLRCCASSVTASARTRSGGT